MHVWFEQTSSPAQPLQAPPPSPHLSFALPSTHVSPSQQPAQLLGPQGSLHLPAMHCWAPAQI